MKAWWSSRAPREQRLLAIGGSAAALMLIWAFVLYPQQRAHLTEADAVQASERDLVWMRQIAPTLQGTPAIGTARSGRSLLAEVDASARSAGLGGMLGRVEPQPNGRVGVSFKDVPFDALMRWLEPFAHQSGARIESLSAQRTSGQGMVDARLVLLEAGSG